MNPLTQLTPACRLVALCLATLLALQPVTVLANDVTPVIVSYLLDDSNDDGPIVLHPDAGTHAAFPLQSTPGALPFGHYRYLPVDFTLDARKPFPLILFLHGLGEKGDGTTNLNKVLANGPPKMIERGIDFPAIVLTPQVTISDWQRQRDGIDIPGDLHTLVAYYKNNFNVDPERIYVTGLSLGGGGAWNYTRLYSDEVAAVVPICGVGTAGANMDQLADLGVWAFHSIDDGVVASRNSARNINRVAGTSLDQPNGVMANYPNDGNDHIVSRVNDTWVWQPGRYNGQGNTRYTIFPDGAHNSWTRAYNENGGLDTPMWEWLFSQRKSVTTQ